MLTSLLIPPLTTYAQNGEEIGKRIASHLIEQIENSDHYHPDHVSVNGNLLIGNSIVRMDRTF